MRATSVIRLVAEREVRQRLRGRSFLLSTSVIVVAVLAIGIISRVTSDDGPEEASITVVGQAPAGFEQAAVDAGQAFGIDVSVQDHPTAASARAALADADLDAVVDAGRRVVLYDEEEDSTLQLLLQQAWSAVSVRGSLAGAGLSAGTIDAALSPPPLGVDTIEAEDEGEGLALAVGSLAGVLLFLSLQTYGGFILMSVVEEKSTAVIEVVLARLRATELLAGKVLGVGAVALAQFLVLVGAGIASLTISGADIPDGVWAALPWTAVWFVGGFGMYAFLFALAGAMVSRQEDAQAASVPVQVLLGAAYFSVFVLVGEPDSGAARVMSLIPPFTPMVMPSRIAAGAAPPLDIAVGLVLVAATVVVLARVSGTIYTKLVLRRGARVRWIEALRPS